MAGVQNEPDKVRTLLRRLESEDLPCPNCGYSFKGLNELRCPECGITFDFRDGHWPVSRRAQRMRRMGGAALSIVTLIGWGTVAISLSSVMEDGAMTLVETGALAVVLSGSLAATFILGSWLIGRWRHRIRRAEQVSGRALVHCLMAIGAVALSAWFSMIILALFGG